ncbi:MAG: hypothetical protein HYX72_11150 [Acidobacteria bacterium]|nr:hypothetical protein [Acidobacteriota bacterium]
MPNCLSVENRPALAWVFLSLVTFSGVSPLFGQQQFDGIQYLKPALSGNKPKAIDGVLFLSRNELAFSGDRGEAVTIRYDTIWKMIYERSSAPRYLSFIIGWPPLPFKAEEHFLTIQYAETGKTVEFAVFRLETQSCDKILLSTQENTRMAVERFRVH